MKDRAPWRALEDILAVGTGTLPAKKRCSVIVGLVAKATGCPAILLEQCTMEGQCWELVASCGIALQDGFYEDTLRRGGSRSRPFLCVPSGCDGLAWRFRIPLRFSGNLVGSLTVGSPDRKRPGMQAKRLITTLAGVIAPVVWETTCAEDGRIPVADKPGTVPGRRVQAHPQAPDALLRLIIEGTQDTFFYIQNPAGTYTYVSQSVKAITGHTPEAWIDNYTKFLTDHPVNAVVRALREETLRAGTVPPPFPCEIIHASGHTLVLELNERPVVQDNRVAGITGIARDVTERRRLETKLLESRDHFNRLLDQTPLAVIVFNPEGTAVDVNTAALHLFGVEEKPAIVGRLGLFTSPLLLGEDVQGRVRAAFSGEVVDLPVFTLTPQMFLPDGPCAAGAHAVRAKLFPVFDHTNTLVNVVLMLEDVSERLHLEQQLLRSQKMESIGLLAGGIAHDFNNILGAILGYASHLKTIPFPDPHVHEQLDTIERSALRAAELTSQLLAFARGGSSAAGPLNVHEIINETARLLRGSFDKKIAVVTRLTASFPVIEGDASQIHQVFMNLCVNARDAMPEGGVLTISTRELDRPDAFLSSRNADAGVPYLRIAIKDTGLGMDKDIQGRIFEPFFTTKEKGRGTGLGLAMVYGIVERHHGHVTFSSEAGKGTTFTVYLPLVKREVAPAAAAPAQKLGGRETILIVDDEQMIRDLVKDILESKGYHVLTARDGEAALDLFARKGESIDLVILDMIMPGMNGLETMRKLKERETHVKTILSTGYSEEQQTKEFLELGVKLFLQKPYRTEDLSNAVREVLDDGGTH